MKTLEPPTEMTRARASNAPTLTFDPPITSNPPILSPMTPPSVPWMDTTPSRSVRQTPEIGVPFPKSRLERALTRMLALAAEDVLALTADEARTPDA